jgi:hypothetical protein
MTVECYETLRETLIWQALKHGKRKNAIPGIREIQRAIMPLMRSSFYSRSEVVALQKRNGGTDNVRVVPRGWAILYNFTAPLIGALFSLSSSASSASVTSIVLDGIDNTPMVRHRKSDAYSSSLIFVDANVE